MLQKIDIAIRSINASSGQDVTNVTANSEREEHVGINASSENASGNNNLLHVSNVSDATRYILPNEVSELSVPETRVDRQSHTHHRRLRLQLLRQLTLLTRIGCVSKVCQIWLHPRFVNFLHLTTKHRVHSPFLQKKLIANTH